MNTKTLALTAAIAATGLFANVSHAAPDGTITVNGQVLAQTCLVDGNAYGTPDNVVVGLPNVLSTALASAGSTAGDTGINIAITNCDAALKTVQTYFSGGDINSAGRLNNSSTAAAVAGNVQVQMLNASGAVMDLSQATATGQNSQVVNLSGGAATMSYTARYYATGAASAGAVKSTVNFTMIYQ